MHIPARSSFGQQPPPPGGYAVARFQGYLAEMSERLEAMQRQRDPRAVFQLTYLTFSRQVLRALESGRFHDHGWATDMCCRFVEVYLEQLALWDARAPEQCGAWRRAFSACERGEVNVMQAMLLGMNAHIHYDLAFVTLGACRHAGDLLEEVGPSRALLGSRGGVPTVRYRDFLLINRVGWESIPLIQDAVLRTFSPALYWGNRATLRATRHLGQRVLLEARDASWAQTCLLLHAREGEEREAVAELIDAFATSVADLIGAFTLRPAHVWRAARAWRLRGEGLTPRVQAVLLAMARRSSAVADLALHQLAFLGADPARTLEALLAAGEERLAATFATLVRELAPARQRVALHALLDEPGPTSTRVVRAMLEDGAQVDGLPWRVTIDRVRRGWAEELRGDRRLLRAPAVARNPVLTSALEGSARRLEVLLRRAGEASSGAAPDGDAGLSSVEVSRALSTHPDPWVRLCAAAAAGGNHMSSVVERVLFLKETELFMEVEPASLVRVAEHLEGRSFDPGTTLLRTGERSGGIWLIRTGEVEVTQSRGKERTVIATLGPGDSVGELSAFNDTPATADCTARTPVTCDFVPADVLSQLMHQHPRLAVGLIRMLSRRLIATTRRVREPAEELRR